VAKKGSDEELVFFVTKGPQRGSSLNFSWRQKGLKEAYL